MLFKKTALMLGAVLAIIAGGAQAQSYHTLYRFKGGADGAKPVGPFVVDGKGNVFGTTELGGANGAGTIFRLTQGMGQEKSETIIHSFGNLINDGCAPWGGLSVDRNGWLYGVTPTCGVFDQGTLFQYSHGELVMFSFNNLTGIYPGTRPVEDMYGVVYGVTPYGGNTAACSLGCGTIYTVAAFSEITLHEFKGSDGAQPFGALAEDNAGDFYGTTMQGGSGGGGTIFEFGPGGLTTLHAFDAGGGKRGDRLTAPNYGVVRDAAGNLYGVAGMAAPAHDKKCPGGNCGAIYMLSRDGKLRVLHAFNGGTDGAVPNGALVMDAAGSLYGTTAAGAQGYGTVFRRSPDGSMAILHAFGASEGSPNGLTLSADGKLYGAAYDTNNPASGGLIFRIDP
jgi:uncharacterized repeat protein (TIGR03803 family)